MVAAKGSPEWCQERKEKATAWARDLFQTSVDDVVVMDTETTGLLADEKSEIVEIAIVSLTGRVLFNSLIKPKRPIPHDATRIHGIRNVDVEDQPTFPEVYDEVASIFNAASMVLVYNKEFDLKMLIRAAADHGLEPFRTKCPGVETNWYCAMKIYSTWVNQWSDYRQDFKFQPLKGGHRALGDCQATIERLREVGADNQIAMGFV